VSMMLGDDMHKNLPWVAVIGSGLLLACDLVGRTVVAPMEIPAGGGGRGGLGGLEFGDQGLGLGLLAEDPAERLGLGLQRLDV
ncbi:iron chelate uptake ABC transporter family permease subunit, partial [Rhodococcus zopfii]|uniref:iron chelate uptake ABC transporter family permease subunit n=1 Tax=Rhodococcus zopfii TaxID=43772 RepID=UPI001EDCD41E